MSNFYLVLGANKTPRVYIDKVLPILYLQYDVVSESNIYWGESEDNPLDDPYLNVACKISTSFKMDDFKSQLKSIENDMDQSIDIDLVLEEENNQVVWYHSKIMRYCHFLITLKELCPNLLIENKTINELLISHPNRLNFKVINHVK